jgi:chaperonin GroEL (HSP60 family)
MVGMERILSASNVISQNYKRSTGKEVWRENLHYAIFAADKVRSTLGPKGAYKMVTYNKGPEQVVKVTKDAIAILDELAIQYPPSVIISEAAKMQREEAGDGVASFVTFTSALLKKADELLNMGIHANTIVHGYNLATERALEILERHATVDGTRDVLDTVDCLRNLLTPQVRGMVRQAYPHLFCEGRFQKENVLFIKKTGSCQEDLQLIKGVVIKKQKAHPNMPDKLKGLRIAVTTERLGINRLEVKMPGQGPYHINLNLKTPQQIRQYSETVQKIKSEPINKLAELGVNVLLCEQPIEENQKSKLQMLGIFALESVDKKDTEAIVRATGAKTVGSLAELASEDIGTADELTTGILELEKTVTFTGCRGSTFLLRGSTAQGMEELETVIKNSFTVLKIMDGDSRVVAGGAAMEAQVAKELQDYAKEFANREQVVIQAYANALLVIPKCLAANYGLNPIDTIAELRHRHALGGWNVGVYGDGCRETVCQEPLRVKRSVLRRAFEVSMLMLRVDELIISKEIPKFHKK